MNSNLTDVTHPIRRLRRFAQIKNKTCVSVVMPAATTPPTATMRVRIYPNNCCNHERLTRQRIKSHLYTVWLTRFQKSCADFVALRNISNLIVILENLFDYLKQYFNPVLFVIFLSKVPWEFYLF
jgi:hypothetical protein